MNDHMQPLFYAYVEVKVKIYLSFCYTQDISVFEMLIFK